MLIDGLQKVLDLGISGAADSIGGVIQITNEKRVKAHHRHGTSVYLSFEQAELLVKALPVLIDQLKQRQLKKTA